MSFERDISIGSAVEPQRDPQRCPPRPTLEDVVVQQLSAMRQQIDALLCLVATGQIGGAVAGRQRPAPPERRVETVENYSAFGKDDPSPPPPPPITNKDASSVDALRELARRVNTGVSTPTAHTLAGENDGQS